MSVTTWAGGGGFSDISLVHPAVTLDRMNQLIDTMAKVKPRWIRTICAWNYITKTRAAGAAVDGPIYGTAPFAYQPPATKNRDWSSLDRCVNEVLRRIPSADILLIIGQGKPKWSGVVSAPNYSDYGDFCVEVADRYAPGTGMGIAPDLRAAGRGITHFEIWNEQNNKGFWTWGNVNPKGYVQMLTDAYTKLKAAHPACTVMFGSYQHVPHTSPWYGYGWITQPEIDWWQECFDNGLGNTFDIVGAHPYSLGDFEYGLGPLEPSLTESDAWLQFGGIRNLLVTNGYADKSWWITEIGYPTSMCTPQQQMDYHLESMGFWQNTFDFIDAYLIYCCLEDGNDPTDKEQTLGIVYHDTFVPKPMFYYLQALQGGLIQTPAPAATAAMPAPIIQTSMTITAPPMTATADMAQGTRVLVNVILPPADRATAAMPAPTVTLSTAVSAAGKPIAATAAMPPPDVTVSNPPPITAVTWAASSPGAMTEFNSGGVRTVSDTIDIPTGLLGSYLLVGLCLSHNYQASWTAYSSLGCTVGGTPMTLLGSSDIGGSFHQGSIHWFGLANPTPGTGVTVTATAGSSVIAMRGLQIQAELLQGVLAIGDKVSNRSSNYWTVNADIETGVYDRAFLLVGSSKQVSSCTGSIRYNGGDPAIDGVGQFMMIADTASDGDGSTRITATFGSCSYGMYGIQVEFDPSLLTMIMMPPAMTAAAAMAAPVVSHTSGGTLTAPPMTATAAMPAPSVSTSSVPLTVTAPPMTATAALPVPAVGSGLIIAAPAATATAAMPAPTVQTSITITAPPMTATAAAPAPTVSVATSITINAVPMTATAAAVAPVWAAVAASVVAAHGATNPTAANSRTVIFDNPGTPAWTPAVDDLVVLFGGAESPITGVNVPAGWVNPLGGTTTVNSSQNGMGVEYHWITSAEAAAGTRTYTCNNMLANSRIGMSTGLVLRGVDRTNPIDIIATTFDSGSTTTPHVIPGVAGVGVGSQDVTCVYPDDVNTYTTPTGWTAQFTLGATAGRCSWMGSRDAITVGASIADTNITPSTGGEYCAISIAFKSKLASVLDVSPDPFTATGDMPAPAVSSSVTITAPAMTATAAMVTPSTGSSGNATVSAVPFTATAAAAAPVVSSTVNVSITAPPMTATADTPAPTVSAGAGPITITSPPMTATAGSVVPILKIAYDLAFSGSTVPTSGPTAQPTIVGHASAAAATVAVPTHQAGDLIIYAAFREGSATAPTADANYTQFFSQTGTSCSMRVAIRKATTSSEPAGTFTNATGVVCIVVRGVDNPSMTATTGGPQTNVAGGSGTGGTITYPAATLLKTGTSLILRFAGQRDATNLTTNTPSGYTAVDGVATEARAIVSSANASSNPTADTQATNGTTGWTAVTMELVAATTSFGTCVPISVSTGTMREGDSEAAVNGDYYEAWLHPSPMDTDLYIGRANSGAAASGSLRGFGFVCAVPDGVAPVTKAVIGIMDQQTAAGCRIMTWDGATWTQQVGRTGSGSSAGTADDVGIKITKSGGIYTYTLQLNQADVSAMSWTDTGGLIGTPGPRFGAAFHHARSSGVQGGSPGVDEIWCADT